MNLLGPLYKIIACKKKTVKEMLTNDGWPKYFLKLRTTVSRKETQEL